MPLGPTVVKFTFPQIIDVSNGPVTVPFTVQGAFGPGNVDIMDISFTTDLAVGMPELLEKIPDGKYTGNPYVSVTTSFDFDARTPAGTYKITSLLIHDAKWNGTIYNADQIASMGWSTEYTIVDSKAPAAPVEAVQGLNDGLLRTSQAVLTGTAAPGSTVAVTALQSMPSTGAFDIKEAIDLGTVQADAAGHWTLTTKALDDGDYTRVRATATLDDHTSPYSSELAFHVAAHAPLAPQLHLRLDANGVASSATPFISGMASANNAVKIYEGATLVGATVADKGGWFGLLATSLPAGAHQLTAVATDPVTHETTSSTFSLATPQPSAAGIHFDIATLDNTTSTAVDRAGIQHALDEVGAILGSLIDGSEHVPVRVHIEDQPAGSALAAAAASAPVAVVDPATGMPVIASMDLYLSTDLAAGLKAGMDPIRGDISVLTHETLHALGFISNVDMAAHWHPATDYRFGELTDFIGGKAYFTGRYATAINGGPVALANAAHLADQGDIMYPSQPDTYSDVAFFGRNNPTAPLTAVDLGILKDLGYTIKDAFVSADGHTFVAGNGQPGHDRVTGTAGFDTLLAGGRAADHGVAKTAAGFSLADHAGRGGTQQLSGIERIQFAQDAIALDVGAGQAGGEAYRLYQAAFNRAPDAAGLGYWIDRLDHGASLRSVADAFVASSEFTGMYGLSQSNRQFVDAVYQNVLHRAPDAEGAAYWYKAMDGGLGRADLLTSFSESSENVTTVGGTISNGFTFTPYHA